MSFPMAVSTGVGGSAGCSGISTSLLYVCRVVLCCGMRRDMVVVNYKSVYICTHRCQKKHAPEDAVELGNVHEAVAQRAGHAAVDVPNHVLSALHARAHDVDGGACRHQSNSIHVV